MFVGLYLPFRGLENVCSKYHYKPVLTVIFNAMKRKTTISTIPSFRTLSLLFQEGISGIRWNALCLIMGEKN